MTNKTETKTSLKEKVTAELLPLAAVDALLERVRAERESHIKNWGEQTHPSYMGEGVRRQYERNAEYYKGVWDAQYRANVVTWDVVLLEEVFEALSELDPEKRIEELVQVAAVALAEAESIAIRNLQLMDEEVPIEPADVAADEDAEVVA